MFAKAIIASCAALGVAFSAFAAEHAPVPLPDPNSVRDIPELAWHATPSSRVCDVSCWDNHTNNVHVAFDSGDANERKGGPHSSPADGLCDEKHPSCNPEFATHFHVSGDVLATLAD
jgi:hypothetical protein